MIQNIIYLDKYPISDWSVNSNVIVIMPYVNYVNLIDGVV